MKTFFSFLSLCALTVSLSAAAVYQCPMHPWIKADHAAKCTICGMDLVASAQPDAGAPTDANLVLLNPAAATVVNVQTSPVQRGTLVRTLRVAGVIDDDDTRHRILAARVPGRVEKLFVNYVGAEVREGAPLATIYSPEMLTAQRTYVERLRAGNAAFTASDRAAARERLLELGLSSDEVVILEHTLEPTAMMNVHAPMSGTVVSRAVYEGQYVQTNDRLFEIGDFSSMWFVFDAHESDLAWLRVGQSVEVTTPSQPGRGLQAPISFIDPNLNEATRTARVRVVLANADRALLHKQTALGFVRLDAADVLLAPRAAVLQHTAKPLVYVEKAQNGYEPREVRLGRVGDDTVEILAGLTAGEKVVTTAALLLDAQAQLARAATTVAPPTAVGAPITMANEHPVLAYEPLKTLALGLADGATALANDDLPAYQQLVPTLREALNQALAADPKGPLAKFKTALRDPSDLKSARRDFEPLSTVVADLAREQHVHHRENLHVYQCPMTPVLGTGRWLSRDPKVRNPFFGSAMLECGEEVK